MPTTAADALCAAVERHGVRHVFGLPGSETIELWDALRRRSGLTTVVPTSELAASFMAIGYARASQLPAVLTTIGGPGFTYALTGLAEARLDSVPLVHLAALPALRVDGGPGLQWIAQAEIAGPLVKRVIQIDSPGAAAAAMDEAFDVASNGEPGPVLVLYEPATLAGRASERAAQLEPEAPPQPELGELVERVLAASRPVFLCGQGARGAAADVVRLAETLQAPVLTTTSGRGVISELHPLSLVQDVPGGSLVELDRLLASSDLVLAVGCRLSHNGSRGFRLRLPAERLVRIDAASEAMGPPYPASLEIVGDAAPIVAALAAAAAAADHASTWTEDELAHVRAKLAAVAAGLRAPLLGGVTPGRFFGALRDAVPDDCVVVTDSGLHQFLVRAHFRVVARDTLLVPADFQSMGFGIPAAVGAALALGERTVAVVGDGGLNMSAFELLTAARFDAQVSVLVLVDRQFGLIRTQQVRRTGASFGVDIPVADLRLLAESFGIGYSRIDDLERDGLGHALGSAPVTVVEVPVDVAPAGALERARSLGVSLARATVGPEALGDLHDALRRRS